MPFSAIRGVRLVGLLLSMFGPSLLAQAATPAGREWPVWGGDAGAMHFSTLDDITPANVAALEGWVSNEFIAEPIACSRMP